MMDAVNKRNFDSETGRRTDIRIDRSVPINKDGLEEIDDFFRAGTNEPIRTHQESILSEQRKGISPINKRIGPSVSPINFKSKSMDLEMEEDGTKDSSTFSKSKLLRKESNISQIFQDERATRIAKKGLNSLEPSTPEYYKNEAKLGNSSIVEEITHVPVPNFEHYTRSPVIIYDDNSRYTISSGLTSGHVSDDFESKKVNFVMNSRKMSNDGNYTLKEHVMEDTTTQTTPKKLISERGASLINEATSPHKKSENLTRELLVTPLSSPEVKEVPISRNFGYNIDREISPVKEEEGIKRESRINMDIDTSSLFDNKNEFRHQNRKFLDIHRSEYPSLRSSSISPSPLSHPKPIIERDRLSRNKKTEKRGTGSTSDSRIYVPVEKKRFKANSDNIEEKISYRPRNISHKRDDSSSQSDLSDVIPEVSFAKRHEHRIKENDIDQKRLISYKRKPRASLNHQDRNLSDDITKKSFKLRDSSISDDSDISPGDITKIVPKKQDEESFFKGKKVEEGSFFERIRRNGKKSTRRSGSSSDSTDIEKIERSPSPKKKSVSFKFQNNDELYSRSNRKVTLMIDQDSEISENSDLPLPEITKGDDDRIIQFSESEISAAEPESKSDSNTKDDSVMGLISTPPYFEKTERLVHQDVPKTPPTPFVENVHKKLYALDESPTRRLLAHKDTGATLSRSNKSSIDIDFSDSVPTSNIDISPSSSPPKLINIPDSEKSLGQTTPKIEDQMDTFMDPPLQDIDDFEPINDVNLDNSDEPVIAKRLPHIEKSSDDSDKMETKPLRHELLSGENVNIEQSRVDALNQAVAETESQNSQRKRRAVRKVYERKIIFVQKRTDTAIHDGGNTVVYPGITIPRSNTFEIYINPLKSRSFRSYTRALYIFVVSGSGLASSDSDVFSFLEGAHIRVDRGREVTLNNTSDTEKLVLFTAEA